MHYQCLSSVPLPLPNVVPKIVPVLSVKLDRHHFKLIYGQHSPLGSTAIPLQSPRSSAPQLSEAHIMRTVSAITLAPNVSKVLLSEAHLANVPFQSHDGASLYKNMGLLLAGGANLSELAKFGVAQQGFTTCLMHHSAPQRPMQSYGLKKRFSLCIRSRMFVCLCQLLRIFQGFTPFLSRPK